MKIDYSYIAEPEQLIAFLAVAKYGSFSKAAERVMRSQSTISNAVATLEVKLGVMLFERAGKRPPRLTKEGEEFQRLAAPIVGALISLETDFLDAVEGAPPRLSIATHSSVVMHILPIPIAKFRKAQPTAEISVVSKSREEILALVRSTEVDLGITSLRSVPQDLCYKVFAKYPRELVAPKRHPLLSKKILTLKDFCQYPIIIRPRGSATRDHFDAVMAKAGLNYHVSLEVTGKDATLEYVRQGEGIALVNNYKGEHSYRNNLCSRDVSKLFGYSERGFVWLNGRAIKDVVSQFMSVIMT
ncbi:MAG: LysR family transcriptional regulator [bacterium]|nr:LysR family transcriptional regulator [bacterium]